jgi:hypothetical protein
MGSACFVLFPSSILFPSPVLTRSGRAGGQLGEATLRVVYTNQSTKELKRLLTQHLLEFWEVMPHSSPELSVSANFLIRGTSTDIFTGKKYSTYSVWFGNDFSYNAREHILCETLIIDTVDDLEQVFTKKLIEQETCRLLEHSFDEGSNVTVEEVLSLVFVLRAFTQRKSHQDMPLQGKQIALF